jgi:hypothetical protein
MTPLQKVIQGGWQGDFFLERIGELRIIILRRKKRMVQHGPKYKSPRREAPNKEIRKKSEQNTNTTCQGP